MYKCIECHKSMLKNTFICAECERDKRAKNERKPQFVREQNTRVLNIPSGSSDNEGSQYWDYVEKHNIYNDEGEAMEVDRANPDYVSADRLKRLEMSSEPPLNETREKAIRLLNEGAKTLTERERVAVGDFGKGVPQKSTALGLKISQPAVAKSLKRGLAKLRGYVKPREL